MSSELDKFSKTVGLIYEAGLNPDNWPVAMQALCSEVNADKAQMLYLDPLEYMISFACGLGFDPYEHNIGASRFRRYFFDDPVAQYGIANLNEVFSDRRVIDPEVLHRSGMHQEIRRPADMEHLLTVFLTDDSADWTGLCFFRSMTQAPFNQGDEDILRRYVDHIRRSTYIHKSVASASRIKDVQNAVLDDLDTGIIVVDELHDVIVCNKSARHTIDASGVLRLENSRLICKNRRENSLLHESIDEALGTQPLQSSRRRIAVRLRGQDQANSILAVTTPLQIQGFEEKRQTLPVATAHYTARIPSRKNALITLCDSALYKNRPAEMLENLFDLTPAEAALANCLADDCSIDAASKMLGRSVGTARVQLQSIFEKTDTNRQSSLIRLIMSIP